MRQFSADEKLNGMKVNTSVFSYNRTFDLWDNFLTHYPTDNRGEKNAKPDILDND